MIELFAYIYSNPIIASIFEFEKMLSAEWNGKDFNGIFLSIFGLIIVFLALLILSFAVASITKLLTYKAMKRLKEEEKAVIHTQKEHVIPDEVNVAIAMALHLHFAEVHDEESGVLTIDRIKRNYSPWNSKIYNLTPRPGKQII